MRIVKNTYSRVLEKPVAGDKVLFIFTAMGTRIGLYRLFMGLMNRHGYSCIIYDYPVSIVHNAVEAEWQSLFTEVIGDAQQKIDTYRMTGTKHFYAYGISMGTLFAHMMAREAPEISHVALNLTYGDVASNLWTYRLVKKAKKNLIAQGYTKESARAVVAFIDPIVNAPKLKGKKVLLYLSKVDKVMLYDQSKETLEAFKKVGLDLQYVENKFLGHYIGGAKNLMSIKQLITFLNS